MDLAPTVNALLTLGVRWLRWTLLADVIFVHAFLIAGALGFSLAAGLERAPDATTTLLLWLDGTPLLGWLDPGERTFRQHGLWLFGWISLIAFAVGGSVSAVRSWIRGEAPVRRRPSLGRTLRRLALADLALAALLFAAVRLLPAADPTGFFWWRAALIALAMGATAFAVSFLPITAGHLLGRGADALAASGWPAADEPRPARDVASPRAPRDDEVQ